MNSFTYQNPVRVVFGAGVVESLGEEAQAIGKRALVVSYADQSGVTELLERCMAQLESAGIKAFPFFQATPNPEISMVERGVVYAKECDVDFVIGIGGGSVMDSAKAIAAGFFYEGDLWQMVYSRHDNIKARPPTAALPTLMIPTLPATGSEMNMCAVVTNGELQEKAYIWSDVLFPKVALFDPELTYTLPPYQTACGAIDTISHVFETYLNGQDKSDMLHEWQEGIMRTVIRNLPLVFKNCADADARAELMWCATCALNGWASPGDAWTPMHQVGHVLTTRYGVAHGASLGLVMPAWMEYFKSSKAERLFKFATAVMRVDGSGVSEEAVVDKGIAAFRSLIAGAGLPTSLSSVGVLESELSAIVADVRRISFNGDGVLSCNPPVTADDLLAVLKLAM